MAAVQRDLAVITRSKRFIAINAVFRASTIWDEMCVMRRALIKTPGFSVAADVTHALGIGANVTVCSVVNAIPSEAVAIPELDSLVHIIERVPGGGRVKVSNTRNLILTPRA